MAPRWLDSGRGTNTPRCFIRNSQCGARRRRVHLWTPRPERPPAQSQDWPCTTTLPSAGPGPVPTRASRGRGRQCLFEGIASLSPV